MVKTTWITCNACNSDTFKKLSIADGWHIGQCTNCSLIYLNPMPFFEPSAEFSDMSLDFQYTQFQYQITEEVLQHDKQQFARQVEILSQLSGTHLTSGKFLDIGCGSGSTVRAAADMGWDAIGIDIDPNLIELGKAQHGVDLRCTPLLESGFDGNQFHFIRLRDVIEHLPNPYEALLEIKRLLAPGGFVLIATPNEDALPTQIRLLLGHKRDQVATVPPPHHVHGFTPKTLKRILERAGLEIHRLGTTTPIDPEYVTARNMNSASNKLHVLLWSAANAIGKGSMLIGWARKVDE
ncbi:MAG TPA: class I SAM-dependent methyltransferase [Coleofasciculaceae cyanobacterium]